MSSETIDPSENVSWPLSRFRLPIELPLDLTSAVLAPSVMAIDRPLVDSVTLADLDALVVDVAKVRLMLKLTVRVLVLFFQRL